jgi:hypothetical protein
MCEGGLAAHRCRGGRWWITLNRASVVIAEIEADEIAFAVACEAAGDLGPQIVDAIADDGDRDAARITARRRLRLAALALAAGSASETGADHAAEHQPA